MLKKKKIKGKVIKKYLLNKEKCPCTYLNNYSKIINLILNKSNTNPKFQRDLEKIIIEIGSNIRKYAVHPVIFKLIKNKNTIYLKIKQKNRFIMPPIKKNKGWKLINCPEKKFYVSNLKKTKIITFKIK